MSTCNGFSRPPAVWKRQFSLVCWSRPSNVRPAKKTMRDERRMTGEQLRNALSDICAPLPSRARRKVIDQLFDEICSSPEGANQRGPISISVTGNSYFVVPGEDLSFAETSVEIAAGLVGLVHDPLGLLTTL